MTGDICGLSEIGVGGKGLIKSGASAVGHNDGLKLSGLGQNRNFGRGNGPEVMIVSTRGVLDLSMLVLLCVKILVDT